jgi:hypothetical protein
MLSPFNAAPTREFVPFGRRPPKLLTAYLPHGDKATCLLLKCDEPGDLLYTLYYEAKARMSSSGRKLTPLGFPRGLDFTCCNAESTYLGICP